MRISVVNGVYSAQSMSCYGGGKSKTEVGYGANSQSFGQTTLKFDDNAVKKSLAKGSSDKGGGIINFWRNIFKNDYLRHDDINPDNLEANYDSIIARLLSRIYGKKDI